MEDFDVIIIGGGPAGAAAGIELLKKGYRCCIIDKAKFPREKLCGGLLTGKTIDLLAGLCPSVDPSEFVVEQTSKVDFYFNTTRVATIAGRQTYYFTRRKDFDHMLIREYLALGGELVENERLKPAGIETGKNRLSLSSGSYGYRYLVAADGCNSVLTKKYGIKRRDAFCLEGECVRDAMQEKDFRIYFGLAKNGYGWYFPKKDHYSVGMGGDNSKKDIAAKADKFFGSMACRVDHIRGAFIPSGRLFSFRRLAPNTLAVGDAAGLIDPVTGEGLYYALLSGMRAAESIHQCSAAGREKVKSLYLDNIRDLRKEIRAALFYQRILYLPTVMGWFMRYLKKHSSFAIFYLDKVMSTNEYSYRNFIWSYILRKMHHGKNS